MPRPKDDLSKSPVALDQRRTLIAVIELSLKNWLVGGIAPRNSPSRRETISSSVMGRESMPWLLPWPRATDTHGSIRPPSCGDEHLVGFDAGAIAQMHVETLVGLLDASRQNASA